MRRECYKRWSRKLLRNLLIRTFRWLNSTITTIITIMATGTTIITTAIIGAAWSWFRAGATTTIITITTITIAAFISAIDLGRALGRAGLGGSFPSVLDA